MLERKGSLQDWAPREKGTTLKMGERNYGSLSALGKSPGLGPLGSLSFPGWGLLGILPIPARMAVRELRAVSPSKVGL